MKGAEKIVGEATLEQSRALACLLLDIHRQDKEDIISITETAKKISIFSLFATVGAVSLTSVLIKAFLRGGGRV